MSIQTVSDPKTPFGEGLKSTGSEGLLLERASRERFAVLPLDEGVTDLLLEPSPRFRADRIEVRKRMDSLQFETQPRSGTGLSVGDRGRPARQRSGQGLPFDVKSRRRNRLPSPRDPRRQSGILRVRSLTVVPDPPGHRGRWIMVTQAPSRYIPRQPALSSERTVTTVDSLAPVRC
jgi:hypothetical protein